MAFDVLLTCNYSPWSRYSGGGQKSVHMLAVAFARQGLRVCVLYTRGPFERVKVPKDLPYAVRWAPFIALRPGISSPLRFLNGLGVLMRASHLSGPKTLLIGNGDEASLLGLVPRKRSFVYTNRYPNFSAFLRGAYWSRTLTWLRILFREPRFVAMAQAMRSADRIVCTSQASRAQVAECFGFAREKLEVIHNGVDPIFLENSDEAPGRQPDLPAEPRGVLFFGRLTHAKGVDTLLHAYAGLSAELRRRHPLTLIGQGPFRGELERLVAELNLTSSVHFRPWASGRELRNAILAHRAAALPSREESFGNTMLEVLATGRPLITTQAGSIPEVVAEHAAMVPPGDAKALREAMERVLGEVVDAERERDAAESRRRYVREGFSWERAALGFNAPGEKIPNGWETRFRD